MATIYDYSAETLDGTPATLAQWRGKVLLIVNTASKCGFTPQYEGLEALHREYAERGLVVLGFPCNQFGGQEPGGAGEIGAFCQKNYGVSFPMMAKVEVKGANAHPLFDFLTHQKRGVFGTPSVKWNFTKFLVGRTGRVIDRFAPRTPPKALEGAIEALL